MKFSVLIPTRDRLDYLKYAVESVWRQNYDNWEIIISDNCSKDDVAGYIHSLSDSRIKYFRTPHFVPVTDNWNNALEQSVGDYVIMLGDDDCLMKKYFTTMDHLISQYGSPDFIYTSAFQYAYPGVMPGYPKGYVQPYGYARFLHDSKTPFLMASDHAQELVRQSMNLRAHFSYNMQLSLVSRRFIYSIQEKGSFFQSPYPDFYATNTLFLKAKRILICPYPLVTIGITPKSFGFFFFNQREAEGTKFLNNKPDPEIAFRLKSVLIPGVSNYTCWLFAMETIKANYGTEFTLKVNYRRYRFLQIGTVYKFCFFDSYVSKAELRELESRMHWWEKLVYSISFRMVYTTLGCFPKTWRVGLINRLRAIVTPFTQFNPRKIEGRYKNILEVFEQLDPFIHW